MEAHIETQQTQTSRIRKERQVDDKPDKATKTVRARSAENTLAYWRTRLFRNTYTAKDGTVCQVPEWYVRLRHAGQTRRVRLKSADREEAVEQARALFVRLQDEGWDAVTDRQARRTGKSRTIEDYITEFLKATKSFEAPPRPITLHLYTRCLRQLCKVVGVEYVYDLTPEAVERFRDLYRAKARKNGRSDQSSQATVANIIRNSAACFSREARAIIQRNGWTVTNPFENIRTKVEVQPVTPLPHHVVERLWAEAPLLRDGDPEAPAPDLKQYVKRYKKTHEGRLPGRWVPIDFRAPHPDSYCALLLALGCGLRANEIDKARWSWFSFDSKRDCYLRVKQEVDFIPKGGTDRAMKIPAALHDALMATRKDMASPYVLGGYPSTESSAKGAGFYRCMEAIRVVNFWLRQRGVEAESRYGKPLHAMRKQFGSELATSHGIFVAQKLLGHSTPTITAKHYAGLTELPTLTHVKLVG